MKVGRTCRSRKADAYRAAGGRQMIHQSNHLPVILSNCHPHIPSSQSQFRWYRGVERSRPIHKVNFRVRMYVPLAAVIASSLCPINSRSRS